jgi:hypothetical protein
MFKTTVGQLPKVGSVTTLALTCACPENFTLSGIPLTIPLSGTSAVVVVAVAVDSVEVEVVVLDRIVVCAMRGALQTNAAVTKIALRTKVICMRRMFMIRSLL